MLFELTTVGRSTLRFGGIPLGKGCSGACTVGSAWSGLVMTLSHGSPRPPIALHESGVGSGVWLPRGRHRPVPWWRFPAWVRATGLCDGPGAPKSVICRGLTVCPPNRLSCHLRSARLSSVASAAARRSAATSLAGLAATMLQAHGGLRVGRRGMIGMATAAATGQQGQGATTTTPAVGAWHPPRGTGTHTQVALAITSATASTGRSTTIGTVSTTARSTTTSTTIIGEATRRRAVPAPPRRSLTWASVCHAA